MLSVTAGRAALGVGFLSMLGLAPKAHAEDAPAIDWGLAYKADVAGALSGGGAHAGRYLDNIDLTADVSLERALDWRGAQLHAHVLSNSGGAPNDVAETLQGIDNIEVSRPRAKLYEFWIEQNFASDRGSALLGLYDLNSEFYQSETAGLLIAPAFGIGSELAATGPNGPSIFPSTALALRLRWSLSRAQHVQAAIINASAGVVGDPDGVDTSFDDGALMIGEWARGGDVRVKLGVWRYSRRQDDIRDVNALGAPVKRAAEGAYASIEAPLWNEDVRAVAGFARIGFADGDTTPYSGGWQAGLLVTRVFEARPDSAFSIGLNQGFLGAKFRANARDSGIDAANAESAVELTYADKLGEHLTLQPDLQFVRNPGGDRARSDVVAAALRVGLEF